MSLTGSFNWLAVALAGSAVLLIGWWFLRKNRRSNSALLDESIQKTHERLGQETLERLGIAREKKKQAVSSRSGLGATELLGIVKGLRSANAQWPTIVVAVNPKSNPAMRWCAMKTTPPDTSTPKLKLLKPRVKVRLGGSLPTEGMDPGKYLVVCENAWLESTGKAHRAAFQFHD